MIGRRGYSPSEGRRCQLGLCDRSEMDRNGWTMVSNWGDFSLSPTPGYMAMSGIIFGCQNLGGGCQAAGVW